MVDELVQKPADMVHTIGFMAGGILGVGKGFKVARGEFMGVPWRYQLVGTIDVNPDRNREAERLTGCPAHTVDLFARRDYVAFHSEFQDLQDTSPELLTELLDACLKARHYIIDGELYAVDDDGLVDLKWGQFWKYDGAWAEVVKWCAPPAGWVEVGAEEMRRIFGQEAPDAMFCSAPCQGNSRLLPGSKADTWKYKALNTLVERCFYLCAIAWPDKPVKVIFNENVPGIKQRSADILNRLRKAAKALGSATDDGDHDAGQVGWLAQSRPRHFWAQRHEATCPAPLYKPPKKGLRPIKDVIYPLPMPGDPKGGLLHELPKLDFVTWLRLALIKPGGDWKDIPGPGEWQLRTLDGRIVPPEAFSKPHTTRSGDHKTKWFAPDESVWGRIFVAELLPGAKNYPDVRIRHSPMGSAHGAFWVQDPAKSTTTVTGDVRPGKTGSAATISDERLDVRCPSKADRHASHYRNIDPDGQAGAVTGADHIANGSQSVADLRFGYREGRHGVQFEIQPVDAPANTITTQTDVQTGAPLTADIRLEFRENRHSTKYEVQDSDKPGDVVTTSDRLGSGAPSLSDVRLSFSPRDNAYAVEDSNRPAAAVPGSASVTSSNGPGAVADLRFASSRYDGSCQVLGPNDHAAPVIGATSVTTSNGPGAVADPRIVRDAKGGTMSVLDGNEPGKTVTTHTDVNGDAHSLADIRMGCKPQNGVMGVVSWNGPSPTVIASLDVYAGSAAIEDVRVTIHNWPEWYPDFFIVSPWNAWHRPLTDLELAALQGFDPFDEEGKPFTLSGSRKDRRQAIGNAVPPPYAEAVAHTLAATLVVSKLLGPDAWMLSPTGEGVWVEQQDPDPAPVVQ